MTDSSNDTLSFREPVLMWTVHETIGRLPAIQYPAMALGMLVNASRTGELQIVQIFDNAADSPEDWRAIEEALRTIGRTRHSMPRFLQD